MQILFGFLLAASFEPKFSTLSRFQKGVYLGTLVSAAATLIMLTAPTAWHRILFRQGDKEHLVKVANRFMVVGLATMGLTSIGVVMLLSDIAFPSWLTALITAVAAVLCVVLWCVLPLARRRALGGGPALPDPHRLDPVLADRLDPDREAVGGDRVAALGEPPELGEHEPADRVVGVGVDRQLEPVVLEVGHRHVPAHEPVAVGQPAHRPAGGVGLVGDLADDLLDDVLDRDDPGRAAVLVDDDRELGPLALQVGQQVVERLGLGHDRGRADERRRSARPSPSFSIFLTSWLTWTIPLTRSWLSSSVTTRREWPVGTQRRSAASTVSETSTVTTAGIGVITWRASCSCRWKTPVSMLASPTSSWPPVVDWAMSRLSSSGVPPSGSASGSVPSIRSIDSDAEFSTMMNGWNRIRKNCIGRAIRRARPSACWIV